jgi:polyferredoxin
MEKNKMTKAANSVLGIFWQGSKLYFSNFISFLKYLAFPVFGQIFGIILIIFASYFYTESLDKIIVPGGIFDNFLMIFFVLLLVILPGLFIVIRAFWEYLVAYGAINSMVDNMLKS